MAERMTRFLTFAAAALAVSVLARAADAQPALKDPTRPPSSGTPAGGARDAAAPPATRLQSILISPQRKLAVIDGRTVALGGKVDEATLVQISETHVVLKNGNDLKTLELYPGIERASAAKGQPTQKKKGIRE